MRFLSYHGFRGSFLPGYQEIEPVGEDFGLRRMDHVVGNVYSIEDVFQYLSHATGWHEFAEFTAEDVGTVDSGLNSMVLGNANQKVLMPLNEPTYGTPRKSQILTYLEHNGCEGVQHIALKTNNIFETLRKMRSRAPYGFDFMPRPSDSYYGKLYAKIGDILTPQQYKDCEELGVLVDKDHEGVLLQIFTKPVGDRPTLFIEIIQRVCQLPDIEGEPPGGCGGFGKGNFSELFKSIEDYEKELDGTSKKIM